MVVIDGFPMDVALVEEPSYTAELTTFPMERGVDINDHLHHNPDMLQLECIVSDTPFKAIEVARLLDEKAVLSTEEVLPSDQAYVRLLQIKTAGEPVSVDTSLDFFEDMVLISMTPSRMGDAIKYTCTFQRASFVTNERTQVRVAVPRVQAPKNLGPKVSFDFLPKTAQAFKYCRKRNPDGSCLYYGQAFIREDGKLIYGDGREMTEDEADNVRAETKKQYELELDESTSGMRPDGSPITWKGRDVTKEGIVFDKDGFANASDQPGAKIAGPPYTGNLE